MKVWSMGGGGSLFLLPMMLCGRDFDHLEPRSARRWLLNYELRLHFFRLKLTMILDSHGATTGVDGTFQKEQNFMNKKKLEYIFAFLYD